MTHQLFNTDNLPELHKFPDNHFKFAVLDPPYGLDTRLTNGNKKSSLGKSFAHYQNQWDIIPPPEFWTQIFRISQIQVVCGANYFNINLSSVAKSHKNVPHNVKHVNKTNDGNTIYHYCNN